jgi:hypothetical protein
VLGQKALVTGDASAPERAPVRGHPAHGQFVNPFVGLPANLASASSSRSRIVRDDGIVVDMQRSGQESQFARDHRSTRLDRRVTGIDPGLKRLCMVAAEGFKRLDRKLDSIIETQRKVRSALERSRRGRPGRVDFDAERARQRGFRALSLAGPQGTGFRDRYQ